MIELLSASPCTYVYDDFKLYEMLL